MVFLLFIPMKLVQKIPSLGSEPYLATLRDFFREIPTQDNYFSLKSSPSWKILEVVWPNIVVTVVGKESISCKSSNRLISAWH